MSDQWQPSEDGLRDLLELLGRTLMPDTQIQAQTMEQLDSFNAVVPDYNNYLAFIMCELKDVDFRLRQQAGILLKNNVSSHFDKLIPAALEHLYTILCQSLNDNQRVVRRTIAMCLSTLVKKGTLGSFQNLVPFLLEALDAQDAFAVHGAMTTLFQICEDSGSQLVDERFGKPIGAIIPRVLSAFNSAEADVRAMALGCVTHFVPVMPPALIANMDSYLQNLFQLCGDTDAKVKRKVCQSFIALLEHAQYILNYLNSIVEFMLVTTEDEDTSVSLEACEFWVAMAESSVCIVGLENHLERLCKTLLDRIIYPLEIVDALEEDECSVPDRPESINPSLYHHASKTSGGGSSGIDGEEDDDDGDYGDYEDPSEWTPRKCAAFAMDLLARPLVAFGPAILPALLPQIAERMNPQNPWPVRESAILALGAISEGCFDEMEDHLPSVVPYLIGSITDSVSLVRSISCWTLSRYASWILAANEPPEVYFEPTLKGLLSCVCDRKKEVQKAACSALAAVEEYADRELMPYVGDILSVLSSAFSVYQERNLIVLYDAVSVLAEKVGEELARSEYFDLLITPLTHKWEQLGDTDRGLIPLLECLTSVSAALGLAFEMYAPGIFERCVRIIRNTLMQRAMSEHTGEEALDINFVVCALDLITGMAEGLGPSFESLVTGSDIVQLGYQCMQDESPGARQSSYALIGILAKHCLPHIRPHLEVIVPILVNAAQPFISFSNVCNNAIWALGEMIAKLGPEMDGTFGVLVDRCEQILCSDELGRGIRETSAVCLGRIAKFSVGVVHPHMQKIVPPWLLVLRSAVDNDDKHDAFEGLCELVLAYPQDMYDYLPFLLGAFLSWKPNIVRPSLKGTMAHIIEEYKNVMGSEEAWNSWLSQLPEDVRHNLYNDYGM